ncbi:MAG: thioredoxin family protein [Bacteroidota bacterium]
MNRTLTIVFIAVFILPLMVGFTPKPHSSGTSNQYIYWMPFGEAIKYAKENEKIIFVYAYTDWCPQCKRMEALTFTDATVQYYLREKFVCTKINAESNVQHECNSQVLTEQQIAQSLEVDEYPTMIMLAPLGGSLGTFSGFHESTELQQILVYFGEGHYRTMPYNMWLKGRR